MLKVLLGCAIVAFTTFCGYILSKKYRQRKLFFRQLFEFNQRFLNEVTYYRRPIQDFVARYEYQGEFADMLQAYVFSLKGEALDLSQYSFLRDDETAILYDYFQTLGKGDSNSQKGYFSGMNDTLSKWKSSSDIEGKKIGDLYIKLGFLCGLFILILIL